MPSRNAPHIHITQYQTADQLSIRRILEHIGWDEPYILAFEQTAARFAENNDMAVFMVRQQVTAVGFLFVQYHAWNRLAQIQGLAVDPAFHRKGLASALVAHAETFARDHGARGIYVDTPTTNTRGRHFYKAVGYQIGYMMPRYYEDTLDGVTYQKFFDGDVYSEPSSTL
ncbi:MAG: GNAT family N-acetyltransferase [Anaerolineae bacterium]|nr:GNAT family N-acetyltransferase [Anaerolineae bacterium]